MLYCFCQQQKGFASRKNRQRCPRDHRQGLSIEADSRNRDLAGRYYQVIY